MAGTTGLEPATSDVTGRRSNQLNYVPAKRNSHDSSTTASGKLRGMINHVLISCFAAAGLLLASGQSGSSGASNSKPSDDKRIEREKGYHYAHPKNTGPTPESAKENNTSRDAKREKKGELDATTPPTRTPESKSAPDDQ